MGKFFTLFVSRNVCHIIFTGKFPPSKLGTCVSSSSKKKSKTNKKKNPNKHKCRKNSPDI